jgi:hypothetical protein
MIGRDADLLHGTISNRPHHVAVPETLIYLDALLVDTPLTGGLEPRLGGTHLRTLTVLGFPSMSRPGILDALNHQRTSAIAGSRAFSRSTKATPPKR